MLCAFYWQQQCLNGQTASSCSHLSLLVIKQTFNTNVSVCFIGSGAGQCLVVHIVSTRGQQSISNESFYWVLLLFNGKKKSFRVYIFVLSIYLCACLEWWRVVYPIYRNYDMVQQRCSFLWRSLWVQQGAVNTGSGAALQERWLGPRDFHNVTWFILLFSSNPWTISRLMLWSIPNPSNKFPQKLIINCFRTQRKQCCLCLIETPWLCYNYYFYILFILFSSEVIKM